MLKPRLQRLAFVHQKSPLYFVTMCTTDRKPLLANPAAHACFRSFATASDLHGFFVGQYLLMPDHLHLFVAQAETSTAILSTWVKSLKNSISKHWRTDGIEAPHWQKGFFDHLLRSAESYSAKWDYVRENPVRAGLVVRADDWPFAGTIHDLAH